jgi:hypothetical protein
MTQSDVAALFVRHDSIYKEMPGVDAWDIERDARNWRGGCPVVAHPPCRAWGRLRHFANPRPDEKTLALWAVDQVRRWGGVLDHPAGSTLWVTAGLPAPRHFDAAGGWTLPVEQHWWGHRATKRTWLYIVGLDPRATPRMPLALGQGSHVISQDGRRRDGSRWAKGDARKRPECTKPEREHTPPMLAEWLVELARRCNVEQSVAA